MRLKLTTIILFVLNIYVNGQAGIDHLLPAPEIISNSGYYGGIRKLLESKEDNNIIISYTVTPSFSPEYEIYVSHFQSKYKITYNRCSENYWYAKNRDSVTVTSKSYIINKRSASIVKEMFTEALLKCRKHIPKENEIVILGMDGTNYYFSGALNNTEIVTGKTWTPSTPKMKELVSICEELKSPNSLNSNELETRMINLTTEIKN